MATPTTIRSTSISRLHDYESCPFKAKLKMIDKIPEPERPLRPGQTEHANDRGSRIHDECEKFVRNQGELPTEARHFKDEFASLKARFNKGHASLEGEWGFSRDWEPTDWKIAWLRVKLDACILIDKQHAAVVDYKSGKRFGNEVKHGEQLQLYALSILLRNPAVEHVTCEDWYLDINDLHSFSCSRTQGLRFFKGFDRRFKRMTETREFPATPNMYSCQYCPYHPIRGSGHCTKGV